MPSGCSLRLLLGASMTGSGNGAQNARSGCHRASASAVVAAGIPAVFCGSAGTDHLCRDVTAVGQKTLGSEASILIDV